MSNMEEFEASFSNQTHEETLRKSVVSEKYNAEGTPVIVEWKKYLPPNPEFNPKHGVIYLIGWPTRVGLPSVEPPAQAWSNESQEQTYCVDTIVGPTENSLYKEAQATLAMIEEQGLTEVTLVGHSEGGSKAAYLAYLIEQRNNHFQNTKPPIKLKGLILVQSMGLKNYSLKSLPYRFIVEEGLMSNRLIKKAKKQGYDVTKAINAMKQAAPDVIGSIYRDLKIHKFNYGKQLWSQIKNMTRMVKVLEEITCPIVLINGAHDPISNLSVINDANKEIDNNEVIQKTLFKKSPYVRVLKPSRMGSHAITLFRPQEVAKTSLYMLNRFYTHRNIYVNSQEQQIA